MSQLNNPPLSEKPGGHTAEQVGIQFNPKQLSVAGIATGDFAIGCFAIIILATIAVLTWGKDSVFAQVFIAVSLVLVFILILLNYFFKKPRVNLTHKLVSFDGIGEKTVALLFRSWLSSTKPPHFPEPDAKFDPSNQKVLPFDPGEKEKILAEQKKIEEKIKKEMDALSNLPALNSAEEK